MQTSPYEEGSPSAPILFIGEAPSSQEVIQGRPFVGPAGQQFNRFLTEAGIVRSDCYIVNTSREPIQDVKEFRGKNGLTGRGLMLAEDLKARLIQARATPNIIVPLGALATTAATSDSRPIGKIRGSPLPCTLLPGNEAIPTIHPAATLSYKYGARSGGNYLWRYHIVSDLKKALRHSHQPGIQRPDRTLLVGPSFLDAMDFLKEMKQASRVGFDIEVYNHQVSCISFAADPLLAMSIPFAWDHFTETQEAQLWRSIASVLEDPSIEKVGQFVSFDISFLMFKNHIRTRGRILDSYIGQRILYPEFPAGLDFLCSIYTDEPYYKDDKKEWTRLDGDYERFWRYNARDAACCLEVWNNGIEPELMSDQDFMHTYNLTMRALEPCLFMMLNGIRIDRKRLAETKIQVERELVELQKQLDEVSERPFNPLSPKQCVSYFYGIKGLKPYINRKTKSPTCDDKALARIIRRDNLLEARLVQQIRGKRKLLSNYLDIDCDPDDRLRCFYNIRGTVTGRLSSSKTVWGTGMNFQNLPPAFKQFLVPDAIRTN
jgi:uracil-DNA glycosylase family 4